MKGSYTLIYNMFLYDGAPIFFLQGKDVGQIFFKDTFKYGSW